MISEKISDFLNEICSSKVIFEQKIENSNLIKITYFNLKNTGHSSINALINLFIIMFKGNEFKILLRLN